MSLCNTPKTLQKLLSFLPTWWSSRFICCWYRGNVFGALNRALSRALGRDLDGRYTGELAGGRILI